jgi:hypothetical protein
MEKDGSSDSTGKDAELDALLSAADSGMIEAIRENLDLETGFTQILGNLAGITPACRPTGPGEVEPGAHAHSYGRALDPVPSSEVASAAHKIPALAGSKRHTEPRYHHRALITLALAVVMALNIAVLCSLSHNHGALGSRYGASPTNPAFEPIPGERPAGRLLLRQLIVLPDKAGASASLRFATDNAGLGGDPVISYLRDTRSGPVLLLSGFPAGTAVRFLAISADRSRRNHSAVSDWSYSFPPGGEQFSPRTMICIAGANGRVMLEAVQNQSSGQIGVSITWFWDLL